MLYAISWINIRGVQTLAKYNPHSRWKLIVPVWAVVLIGSHFDMGNFMTMGLSYH